MRILVVAVGRSRRDAAGELYKTYADRPRWPMALREVETKGRFAAGEARSREARLLLAEVPAGATVVALDGRGEALSSAAFAARLGAWRDQGVGVLAFLIGGAEGLDRRVLERADLVLSLGPMTWPHLLVRGLLAEQLYRAQSILAGHPYHRA